MSSGDAYGVAQRMADTAAAMARTASCNIAGGAIGQGAAVRMLEEQQRAGQCQFGVAIGTAPEPVRDIQRQMQTLGMEVDGLVQMLGMLLSRLEPVLGPQQPAPAADPEVPAPSGLGQRIQAESLRIRAAHHDMCFALERLQLP